MLRKILLLTSTLLILMGCTSKRADEYVQGQGQNDLWSISQFQDKYFDVETHGALIVKKATEADKLKLATGSDSYEQLNNFDLVNYTTNSTLMKDVPFRAKKNSFYQIRYVISKDYLKIMKVAKKELLPTQEQIIAKQIPGKDLWEVPLIGYPISLIKVQKVEDSNGDETSKLNEFRSSDLGDASHFRIDITNRTLFNSFEKNDVFPKDLFAGEWFYAATIVSANTENSNLVGRDLSVDSEQAYVSRIKFINTVNSVIGMNANMDENIDATDEINANAAFEIPVSWVDYRIATIGKDSVLREEEISDGHQEAKHWEERQYMKVDFAHTKAGFGVNEDNVVLNPKFQNLEIAAKYISFMIYYPDSGIRVKYALRKAPDQAKTGRVYFKEDRTKFGFFQTHQQFIKNHRYYYRDDFDRKVLLNRFYPENGKIEYRFTHTTPEELRPAARRAIESWNDIFKKADTGYEIVLKEDADVDLGDIRYNIINIVDTKDGARLLGYGPSIADTKSGEIISATTNAYVNPFRDGLASKLRLYIRYRLGMLSETHLNAPETNSPKVNSISLMLSFYEGLEKNSDSPETKELYSLQKAYFEENNKNEIEAYQLHQELIKSNQTKISFHEHHFGEKCSYQMHANDVIKQIEKKCTKKFLPYVEELIAKGITHDDRELDMMESCIESLMEEELLATLVHEMGHNFGLRHNFSASNDPANFYDEKDTNGVRVKTSSTMDYNNGQSYELLKPGLYDLAAIRFGYANTVETIDGRIEGIDIEKTLDQNIADKKLKLRQFNYCTDEHVDDKDPLCKRWDYGENPLEVVNAIIANYHATYATSGYKYDKAYGPLQVQFDQTISSNILIPLKQIYEYWRFLLTTYLQKTHQHLEMYSVEQYQQILENMKNDTGIHGQHYAQYYQASEKAYNFLKSLVTMTARYCVTQNVNDSVSLLNYSDFETVRSNVYKEKNTTIFNCNDSAALDYYSDKQERLIRIVGEYFNGVSQSLNPFDEVETYYVWGMPQELLQIAGTETIRKMAINMLTTRNPLLNLSAKQNNSVNFLDDPIHRKEMIDLLTAQALYGTSSEQLGTDDLEKRRVPLFKLDQETKSFTLVRLLEGIAIPTNNDETLKRWSAFKPYAANLSNAHNIPAHYAQTQVDSLVYYATQDRAYAYQIINQIERLKMLSKMDPSTIAIPNSSKLKEFIQKNVSLIKQEQLDKMTLEQLTQALKQINDQVNSLEQNTKEIVKAVLKQEISFANAIDKKGEALQSYLQENAIAVLADQFRIPADQVVCHEKSLSTRINEFIESQKSLQQAALDYQENAYEYQAQLNMLRMIIQSLARF